MKKIIIGVLVVALLAAGGFIGYKVYKDKTDKSSEDKKDSNSIVGYWENNDYGLSFIYTFNEDGTGEYDAAGTIMEFTYKTDGDKISILYTGNTVSFDTEYKIDGDTLNVIDSLGDDTLYKRISSKPKNNSSTDSSNTKKSEQKGTAGSNISIKDNQEEAEYQIKLAVKELLEKNYGSKLSDSKINVTKIYTAEEEEKVPALKEMNLGSNKVAFEVDIELKPAANADIIEFTVPNGEYDEKSGWVKEISRLGILVQDKNDNTKYTIENFGTGW
ncbi:MAG: hypothetical protein IKG42_01155 [Clostridia bacterium]|nr:hypothetical protein [Clostridia bacterium]